MSLLRVELSRLRSRRSLWLVAALAVVVSLAFAVVTAYNSRPISDAERTDAAAQAEIASRDDDVQSTVRSCQADPTAFLGPSGTAAECADALEPTADTFLDREPLRLGVVMRNNGLSVALLVLVLVALVGAAFAGSDWASGSITTQLLAEPRRGRVWAAKAVAASLAGTGVAALAMVLFWVPLRVVAAQRGIDVLVGPEVVWYAVRVVALAAFVALVAFALTMLFRQTVVTIGLLFGASLAAELLLGLVPLQGTGWLSPSNNVFAWVLGSTRYLDGSVSCSAAACDRLRTLDMWPAAALMVGVTVIVCAVSLTLFRRRDLP